jgi:hypothetical protein
MKCKALEGLIGSFSYQSYLKAKILHALACQDQLRKTMKQSLKPSPQFTPIAITSTMTSVESAKDPTTETEKDAWKKTEQQFTTYVREAPSLPKRRTINRSTGSAAQSTSILVKISPMRASNVCVGIIATRKCVKITSSMNLSSDPSARNAMYKAKLAFIPHVTSIRFCRSGLALTDHILLNRAYRDCKKEWVCPPKISKPL